MTVPVCANVNIPLVIEGNIRAEWAEAKRHRDEIKAALTDATAYVTRLEKIAEAAEVPLDDHTTEGK